ncbi:MAG: hypothetical protein U5J97_01375 [Trueperaceae bacterium]|nr:hypothetical protein [Trueperaceae bacterium]
MPFSLVPLVGPFHRRFPRYNAITVLEIVAAAEPDAVVTTALPPGALDDPAWQDVDEPGLQAVVRWARDAGVPLAEVGEPSPDPTAQADFVRYLAQSAEDHPALRRLAEVRGPLEELLARALDLSRIQNELLPAVAALHDARIELFGDGPGSDWLEQRVDRMVERLAPWSDRRTLVLSPVDHLPVLARRLAEAASDAADVPPSAAARQRALLDTAFAGEADDAAGLIAALREIDAAEARLAEAEVLLKHGHAAEALAVLRDAVRGDFSEPPYLPGWLLARLGQLYDLDGRRDDAKRSYRGVLALSWAPAPARDAAREGLERPFAAPTTDAAD